MPNATDYYAVSSNEAIIPPPSTIQVKRIKSKLHRSKSKERKASKTNANKVAGVVVGKVAMASPNLNKTEKYCIEPNYKKKLLTNHHKKISPNRHDQTFHHPSYCGSGSAHDMIRRVVAPLNMVQKQDARLAHNSSLSFSNYRVATAKPNTSRAPSPPMSSRIINDSQENDDIDWNRDDDAFFLLASDVLEQLSPHNTSIDPEKLEQILPQSMRNIFIQSIRHRMDLLPIKPDKMESQTDRITRKCQSLWLASFDPLLNPLLQSQSINSEVQSKQAHDLNKRSETHTTSMITSYSTNDIVKKKEPELMNQLVQVRKLLAGSKTEPSTSFWKRQVELLEEQIQSLRSSNDNNVTSTLNPQKQQERQPQLQQNGVTNENKTLKRHPSSPCPYVPLTDENNEIKSFSEPTVVFPPSKNEKGTAKVTPMVNIIAPADLPGGYTFEAYVGGTKILAKVPPGGVIKGQMFTTPMESLDEIRTTVKIGDWRDGICDCFSHGLCHSLFLCTLFFPQISLGQIMTRSQLDWLGNPRSSKYETNHTCMATAVLYVSWIALNAFIIYLVNDNWRRGQFPEISHLTTIAVLNVAFILYTIYTVASTRSRLRAQYKIEQQVCYGCEDVCCAMWCTTCTIAQMGRHTGNFDTYRGVCCSKTGLPPHINAYQGPIDSV